MRGTWDERLKTWEAWEACIYVLKKEKKDNLG